MLIALTHAVGERNQPNPLNILFYRNYVSNFESAWQSFLTKTIFLQKKLTFFSKNGPKNHFLSILTIGRNSEFRNQNSELLKKYFYKSEDKKMNTIKPVEELTFTDDFMFWRR